MKLFVCPLVALILLQTSLAFAASEYNSLTPEVRQKKAAVLAAPSGEDEPIEAELLVLPKTIIEQQQTPSGLERAASEALVAPTKSEGLQDGLSQKSLSQFGYDIFTSIPTTFAPVTGIPVPENYVVGPGDTFVVQVFSATDVQYTLVVTREGKLLIPEVGDIQVSGLSFAEAKLLINQSIQSLRIGSKSVVTLSELHSIQVLIVGEVSQPGTYTVSGLSSLMNALVYAGGIRRSGSLRDIQVKRNGEIISRFDVYELLLKGVDAQNISLRQGDIIFVPPIGKTVGIAGEVQRPAIYELKNERNVGDVIALSGGLLPKAALSKTQVERIEGSNGYTILEADLTVVGRSVLVANGDLVKVLPVLDKLNDVVFVSGHVVSPGSYQWKQGLKVHDLFSEINTFRQGTDFSIGLIEREDSESKRVKVLYFNLEEALSGNPRHDLSLSPRDTIRIFDTQADRNQLLATLVERLKSQRTFKRPAQVVKINGYVRHPGDYPLADQLRALDLIEYSGGFGDGLDREVFLLARTDPITGKLLILDLSIREALADPSGDHNPILTATDRLYLFGPKIERSNILEQEVKRIRDQSSLREVPFLVTISGPVSHPGVYPMTPGMSVEKLIKLAGGLDVSAFAKQAVLARKNEQSNESTKLINYDVTLSKPTSLSPNQETLLKPYDEIIIRKKPEWITKPLRVTVNGEVQYPGTYTLDKRETLCGLIQRAGGFTENAYLFGAVFLRDSVRRREQDALDRVMGELDDLLAEVHLSPGFQKDEKMPVNQSTHDTYRVIKELAPKKALGRMVIDLRGAVDNCGYDLDLVLEDGDSITVPKYQDEVSVVGQVYFPTSHQYKASQAALDYINLSGGTKELAQREHAYIVQANGEVMTVRSGASTWGWLMQPKNVKVTPGSTIYVPLSVDRINGREFTQSWVDLFYKLTLSVASIDYLFK